MNEMLVPGQKEMERKKESPTMKDDGAGLGVRS
jgi:hypothetical protein